MASYFELEIHELEKDFEQKEQNINLTGKIKLWLHYFDAAKTQVKGKRLCSCTKKGNNEGGGQGGMEVTLFKAQEIMTFVHAIITFKM